MAIGGLASVAAVYLVIRRVFFGILLPGWPSLIVSVWLLGGMILACLGIIGIYLSKIFIETKQRPYTIVRNVYERTADPAELRRSSQTVARYYSEKLRQFGATHRGVDWSTAASQELRFSRLLEVLEARWMRRTRLAHRLWLRIWRAGSTISAPPGVASGYCGFDISEAMIEAAPARHAGVAHASFTADQSHCVARRLRRGERHLQRQARITRRRHVAGLRVCRRWRSLQSL